MKTKRTLPGIGWLAPAALLLAWAAGAAAAPQPAAPTPTPTPGRASDNPEDVRARMPRRPTPFEPESKFPPPQQSAEEEARKSNAPAEPDLLHGEPAILLDGQPFPERKPYDPHFPEARRMRYAAADAASAGDGSAGHPWKDLQDALCRLEPGDRLVVASGIYAGSFRVAGSCRDGTAEAPIQVFARHAFLKAAEGGGDVLTIERAHWQLWEVQIALLDSPVAGFVTAGPGAHDIAVDQSHIYEGEGPAVLIKAGSAGVTLTNCHIHQSRGVRIEAGASRITLRNNHIHHNRAASVTVGGGADSTATAREIAIEGNRIHNDHGPALDLSRCQGISLTRNRLSNYRPDPDEGTSGEAIVVRSGCRDVRFESNSVLEASFAVRIGAGAGSAPERIFFSRNYFENQLTSDSTALWVEGGREIRFWNNVVNHYAEPFRIAAAGAPGVSVANNLVLQPTLAFRLPASPVAGFFDYNVFAAGPSLSADLGAGPVPAAPWMASHMLHSRIVAGAALAGGDLGKVQGFSPIDAGKAFEGMSFQGSAPDIGVAEK